MRNIRVYRTDALDNRLLNASFEYVQAAKNDPPFPGWQNAVFRGQPQATGQWRSTSGSGSPSAVELTLTGSAQAGDQLGIQQPCGMLRRRGIKVDLNADVWIPADLKDVYLWVGATIYNARDTLYIGMAEKATTGGWAHKAATGQIPLEGGPYDCVFTASLVAEKPLTGVDYSANIDHIVLRVRE
jgi:hypothetical protein